jgi:hypothetical protein
MFVLVMEFRYYDISFYSKLKKFGLGLGGYEYKPTYRLNYACCPHNLGCFWQGSTCSTLAPRSSCMLHCTEQNGSNS